MKIATVSNAESQASRTEARNARTCRDALKASDASARAPPVAPSVLAGWLGCTEKAASVLSRVSFSKCAAASS